MNSVLEEMYKELASRVKDGSDLAREGKCTAEHALDMAEKAKKIQAHIPTGAAYAGGGLIVCCTALTARKRAERWPA